MTAAVEAGDRDLLAPATADAVLAGAPWRRFAVLGDSIAEGLGDPVPGYERLPWAERVARGLRRVRPELQALNLGRRDLRAAEVRATQLWPALAFAPDLAAVVCGGNDILARDFAADAVAEDLDGIVGPLAREGADVLLFTLLDITAALELPEPHGSRLRERSSTLRDIVLAVAERHGALVVDAAAHPRCADPGIYSADLLHANMRGHALVASLTMRRLGDRLS